MTIFLHFYSKVKSTICDEKIIDSMRIKECGKRFRCTSNTIAQRLHI